MTRFRFFGFRSVTLPLALGVVVGCSGVPDEGPSMAVRDSAGISIVENGGGRPSDGGGWVVSHQPTVEIGSFDGPEEEQLMRVNGVARLSDGRIAIADRGTLNLRVFGADGSHLLTLGGAGEGPGEFQSVDLAGSLPGDTLVLVDYRLQRVSYFHPEVGFLRSVPMPSTELYYIRSKGLLSDGSVIMEALIMDALGAEGYERRNTAFVSVSGDGERATDLGRFPGGESVMRTGQTEHGLATYLTTVPFGKSGLSTAKGSFFYYGSQDRYEVQVHDLSGKLTRMVRLDREPTPVTAADLEAYVASEVADAADEDEAREVRQQAEAGPVPQFHPAYGQILADPFGCLFVMDSKKPGETEAYWSVFDPEGGLVGSFEVPDGVEVLEIGDDYLLGLSRDEFEVEYVRVYGLTRPGV